MSIFIISHTVDVHACAVAVALRRLGIKIAYLSEPDHIGEMTYSARLGHENRNRNTIQVNGRSVNCSEFSLIWHRRQRYVNMSPQVHPEDCAFVRRENLLFNRQLLSLFNPDAVWINEYGLTLSSEDKIKQLTLATKIGLNIPTTLVSNDPESIVAFMGEMGNLEPGVIYKPFNGTKWNDAGGDTRMCFTSLVNSRDISSSADLIKCVPGIYQRAIDKAFEVRSNFFGDECISVKIRSNDSPDAKQDWRGSKELRNLLDPFELPREIRTKCLELLGLLKIRTGCFDFIVNDAGEFVFLEVNPQGQFLWIDEALPSARLFEAFVRYLAAEYWGFHPPKGSEDLDILSFEETIESELFKNTAREIFDHRFVELDDDKSS